MPKRVQLNKDGVNIEANSEHSGSTMLIVPQMYELENQARRVRCNKLKEDFILRCLYLLIGAF